MILRRIRGSLVLVAVLGLVLATSGGPARAAEPFGMQHRPPGLVMRGQPVALYATLDLPPGSDGVPTGEAWVRGDPGKAFTRLPLAWTDGQSTLSTTVPARLLKGRFIETYIVARVPRLGTRTLPAAGMARPWRTWILDDPPTIRLLPHRFGLIDEPEAIVARAGTGSGDDQIGIECPTEGQCAQPTSFDVATDGTVWLADPANHRLLRWTAGQPQAPSRAIDLDFTPIDLAIAPNGTLYVSGVVPGDPIVGDRLYAFDQNGRQLWMSRLLSELFNVHIRMGPGGILYASEPGIDLWTHAVEADGRPLGRDAQARAIEPYQPLSRTRQLVTSGSGDALVAVVVAGKLERGWRIPVADSLNLSFEAVPVVVAGDPVLVFDVYKFDEQLKERVVLRLSPDGTVAGRLTLGRGGYRGGDTVTDVRVGGDGKLYQLQTDPAWGMRLARYSLPPGPAPAATPAATSSPSSLPSASVPETATPSASSSPVPSGSATPTTPPSPVAEPPAPSSGGGGAVAFVVVVLGLVVAGIAALAWTRRTRATRRP